MNDKPVDAEASGSRHDSSCTLTGTNVEDVLHAGGVEDSGGAAHGQGVGQLHQQLRGEAHLQHDMCPAASA